MNFEIKIINKDKFPEKLKKIKNAPEILYAIGNINLLYENCFGIVGTRKPTDYGEKICKEFSKEFVLRDIPIVSGMAIGIDQIAHETVLGFNGKTIGVLGCGFEYFLQFEKNKELFSTIINENGLILSEYDIKTEKNKKNFPERNRIISAISDGILVVEASYRSGSSITAKWARKYGKEVFAVPGRITDKMSVGTNNLIQKGAILTTEAIKIIKFYPQFSDRKRKTFSKIKKNNKLTKKEWEEIIKILEKESLSIEELKIKTKKDIKSLMKILSEMEIEQIIEQDIGIGYKLK